VAAGGQASALGQAASLLTGPGQPGAVLQAGPHPLCCLPPFHNRAAPLQTPPVLAKPVWHPTVTVNATVVPALPAASRGVQDTVVAVALTVNTPVCLVVSLARNTRGLPTKLPVQVMVGSGVTLSVAVMFGKVTVALAALGPAVALRAVVAMVSTGLVVSACRRCREAGGRGRGPAAAGVGGSA
jgi:hypothetical protein